MPLETIWSQNSRLGESTSQELGVVKHGRVLREQWRISPGHCLAGVAVRGV